MKYERLTPRTLLSDVINKYNLRAYVLRDMMFGGRNMIELVDRLVELENKIESGKLISTVQSEQGEQEIEFFVKHNAEVRKEAVKEYLMKTYPESRLTDLLIEFDEMGFCPTTVCSPPEQYAIEWKEQLVKEIQNLQSEIVELQTCLAILQLRKYSSGSSIARNLRRMFIRRKKKNND